MEIIFKKILKSIFYSSIVYFTLFVPLFTFIFKQEISCSDTELYSIAILMLAPYVIPILSLIIYIVFPQILSKAGKNEDIFLSSNRKKIVIACIVLTFLSLFTPLGHLHLQTASLPMMLSGCYHEQCLGAVMLSVLTTLVTQVVLLYFFFKAVLRIIYQNK